jgi:hypothetical protein
MTTLKVDKELNIIDLDSFTHRKLGKIVVNSEGLAKFEREKQQVGFVRLPIRLSTEEEEQLCWLLREYY